jgi:hypothetical protein
MIDWSHPEQLKGTHNDYARRGARAQQPSAKARSKEAEVQRQARFERDKLKFMEMMR